MDRRSFFKSGLAAGAAVVTITQLPNRAQAATVPPAKFKLNYAPQLGAFSKLVGEDLFDQVKFMADQGFTALFDNGMMGKPVDVQEKLARELDRHGMTMGPFVVQANFSTSTFVSRDVDARREMVKAIKAGVECAQRINGRWMLLVPGAVDPSVDWDYQTANLVENLKACAAAAEPSGKIIVLEPLNKQDHPKLFLTKISQAYQICKAVGSPSCKILNDLYHQQITEGNLIHNIDTAWDEIACFHLGDVPGRCEPTTGEINFRNIFKHLYDKKFTGVLGMEHGARNGNSRESHLAVIAAYRQCDAFPV